MTDEETDIALPPMTITEANRIMVSYGARFALDAVIETMQKSALAASAQGVTAQDNAALGICQAFTATKEKFLADIVTRAMAKLNIEEEGQ